MKKIFKVLVMFFAVWLAFFNPVNLSLVYAQVDTPTDTPVATDLPSPDSIISPSPSPDQNLTSGDVTSSADSQTDSNISDITVTPTPTDLPSPTATDSATIDPEATPSGTPTDTPTDDPSPTPSPTNISVDQSGTTSTDTTSSADSGNNSQTDASGSADLTTGNAESLSNSITVTNLSSIDSNLITTIQNILTSDAGDVDLYQLLQNAITANPNVIPSDTNININQNADVNTNTSSDSNTGNNTQDPRTASMTTGGAVALSNAITATNLSEVGSNTILAIINILSDWGGNIILPDGSELSLSQVSGNANVNINQSGQVSSVTSSSANSGNNNQEGGNATMTTGNSSSTANSANLINIIQIGNGMGYLIINNSGNWTGSLINWIAPGSVQSFGTGNYDLVENYGSSGTGTGENANITVNQNANVVSTVIANANTGGNNQTGGNVTMTTGNAASIANNITLTNLTNVGGGFFLGVINIFGHWTGSIYSGPKPPDPSPDPAQAADPTSDSTPDTRTPDLSVDVWNNVAAFVYPGDTVRAAITITNNSSFIAHNVTINGSITDDHPIPGVPMNWNLGDVRGGGKVKISFNVTIPKDVQTAVYHITATATGQAESGNSPSSNTATSNFLVEGFANFISTLTPKVSAAAVGPIVPQVLGESTTGSHDITKDWPYILSGIGILYLLVIIARRKLQRS